AAGPDGPSRWVPGAAARAPVHRERARHDAILVGGGTLRADAPRLDVRVAGLEHLSPPRFVLTGGNVPDDWAALRAPDEIRTLEVQHPFVEGRAAPADPLVAPARVDP